MRVVAIFHDPHPNPLPQERERGCLHLRAPAGKRDGQSGAAVPHGRRVEILRRGQGAGQGGSDDIRGRVHAILGENGAGKSTLIKVMAGVVAPDGGRMTMEGRDVAFATPAAAQAAGIACIFQELSLVSRTQRRRQHPDQPAAQAVRPDRSAPAARDGGGGADPGPARPTFTRAPPSRTCRCRGGRWSRSPRRWPAIPAFSSSTRRPRR